MDLNILISKAEEALEVLESFSPYGDDLWFTDSDDEAFDKAVYELREAIAKAKGENNE